MKVPDAPTSPAPGIITAPTSSTGSAVRKRVPSTRFGNGPPGAGAPALAFSPGSFRKATGGRTFSFAGQEDDDDDSTPTLSPV